MGQYAVIDYSIDNLCDIISVENGISLAALKHKLHVVYLEDYFRFMGVRTIVSEPDYIDKDYLEDYAAYYVRSFNSYKPTCLRLHFFSKGINPGEFNSILTNTSEVDLSNDYVGFIVIKPLPQTSRFRRVSGTGPCAAAPLIGNTSSKA